MWFYLDCINQLMYPRIAMLKFTKLLMILFILFASSFAQAQHDGPIGSSGGGSIVITKDKKAHLIDLVTSDIPKSETLNLSEVKVTLYESYPAKIIGTLNNSRINIAKNKALQLIEELNQRIDHKNLQILKKISTHYSIIIGTDAFLESKYPEATFHQNGNEILAAYFDYGVILINLPISSMMSDQDLTGLILHEILRQQNYIIGTKNQLSTKEIQKMVRAIIEKDDSIVKKILSNTKNGAELTFSPSEYRIVKNLCNQAKKKYESGNFELAKIYAQKATKEYYRFEVIQTARVDFKNRNTDLNDMSSSSRPLGILSRTHAFQNDFEEVISRFETAIYYPNKTKVEWIGKIDPFTFEIEDHLNLDNIDKEIGTSIRIQAIKEIFQEELSRDPSDEELNYMLFKTGEAKICYE